MPADGVHRAAVGLIVVEKMVERAYQYFVAILLEQAACNDCAIKADGDGHKVWRLFSRRLFWPPAARKRRRDFLKKDSENIERIDGFYPFPRKKVGYLPSIHRIFRSI